jgi:hypothetical protein
LFDVVVGKIGGYFGRNTVVVMKKLDYMDGFVVLSILGPCFELVLLFELPVPQFQLPLRGFEDSWPLK